MKVRGGKNIILYISSMKKWLLAILLMITTLTHAQNEFAATAFYNEFRKIYSDAQNGFAINKGDKKMTGLDDLFSEFACKLSLPLADSCKLVFPVNGTPYVVYYFEAGKGRLKVDQRGLNLREAVVTAFGQPLYARTESVVREEKVFSSTYFYMIPEEEDKKKALFKSSIYQQNGLFYLTFEIRGRSL